MLPEALNSLDYALAIESENPMALSLKASILLRQERWKEALEAIKPVMEKDTNPLTAELYVRALYNTDHEAEARKLLVKYCREFPAERALMDLALICDLKELPQLLDAHYAETAESNPWEPWIRGMYLNGHLGSVVEVLQIVYAHDALDYQLLKVLATAVYCSGDYRMSIQMLKTALGKDDPQILLSPAVVGGGLMAALRTAKTKKSVKELYDRVVDAMPMNIKDDWTIAGGIERLGFQSFMSMMEVMIKEFGKYDIDQVDPFIFPSCYREDD